MKRFTILLLVVVLAFVFVITAFAAPPEKETFEFDVVYPFFDCGLVGVGEFLIFNNEVGSGSLKTFYDNDGNLIKEKGHINGTDHLFVESNPDNVVAGKFATNWTTYVDPQTGTYTFSHEPGNW